MYYNKEYHDCNSGDTAQRGCIPYEYEYWTERSRQVDNENPVFPLLCETIERNIWPKDIFPVWSLLCGFHPYFHGYAQISGLPAAYGLYGSLLPIILFALFSTSRQFIFGVDAAPAAIV